MTSNTYSKTKEIVLGEQKDPTIDISVDTIKKKKQALVFCNSKRGAEKTAEDISKKFKSTAEYELMEKEITKIVSPPTKQCIRLGICIKKGIAFHHSGLHSKQRELIEQWFRDGKIHIIASTPTLAAGLDMPAYRTIIKDLKRFSNGYYDFIPVLEYHQMAGRAGRPGKEKEGQSICIAKDEYEKEDMIEKYLFGPPEVIYSKLAVEPVLRMYTLSLISSRFLRTYDQMVDFFRSTFWASQFNDLPKLTYIIKKVLKLLSEWEFIVIEKDDDEIKIKSTRLGTRVSQLYLDPLTAHEVINALERAESKAATEISYLQMIANTLELRPLLNVSAKEYQAVEQFLIENESDIITFIPSNFDFEYETYLKSIKTTMFLNEWIHEESEKDLMEKYKIRPGEINSKLTNADWLLYSAIEISRIKGLKKQLTPLNKVRIRLKYGIKDELLALVRFKNIGRARARILFRNRIRTVPDIKSISLQTLANLVGVKLAKDLKEQVGEKVENIAVKENKRKGQINLNDFSDK